MMTGYTPANWPAEHENQFNMQENNQEIQAGNDLELQQETQVNVKAQLQEIQDKTINQLKSALVINQILASSVEILSKYHLTKEEKEKIIQKLNNCKTLEEVEIVEGILEEELTRGKSQDELMEARDCIWSEGFKQQLNIAPRYSVEDISNIHEGVREVEKYFELLSVYASSQDDPEKMQKTGEQILIQETEARKGLSKIITHSA